MSKHSLAENWVREGILWMVMTMYVASASVQSLLHHPEIPKSEQPMTNAKNSPTPPIFGSRISGRKNVLGDYVASAIVQSLLHHPTLHPLSLLTYRPIFVLLLTSLPNSWIFLGSRKELHILSPEILPYFCSPPNFPTQRYFLV